MFTRQKPFLSHWVWRYHDLLAHQDNAKEKVLMGITLLAIRLRRWWCCADREQAKAGSKASSSRRQQHLMVREGKEASTIF